LLLLARMDFEIRVDGDKPSQGNQIYLIRCSQEAHIGELLLFLGSDP
jgi:hypothetical protein